MVYEHVDFKENLEPLLSLVKDVARKVGLDSFLKSRLGKVRYNMKEPKVLLKSVPEFKRLISVEHRKQYFNSFDKKEHENNVELLWKNRRPKIDKIDRKIDAAKIKVQQMTPDYIDQLMGLYERKNTSKMDKIYIITELQKYYSPKIMQFFYKLNNTELNKQLRWIAFYHLQSFNYQPIARHQKYMQVHTKKKEKEIFET